MKNKITEEIKRSLLLMNYDCKKTLTEQGFNPPPPSDEESIDVPKVPNWDAAKDWIMTQKEPENKLYTPEGLPQYEYAKYKNNDGNWMEIKSDGKAQEADPSGTRLKKTGTWKWNGTEVIFSWLGKKRAGNQWENAKARLKTNGIDDYKTYINPRIPYVQSDFIYSDGEWSPGGYNYAKIVTEGNLELEIRDNFTWRFYVRDKNDVKSSGKWSWDGSKIVFARGVTKKSSGALSEEDTDLNISIMIKNKIGKIGAKGPAVKEIQFELTPEESGNEYGTGDGCGDETEKCTGIYDVKTKELVKTWQENRNLKADGLWGKESQRHLDTSNEEDESDID
jgi:hypothetical protein